MNPNAYIMNTELASDTKTIYYTVNMVISNKVGHFNTRLYSFSIACKPV